MHIRLAKFLLMKRALRSGDTIRDIFYLTSVLEKKKASRTVFSMKNVPGYRKRTRSGGEGVKTYQVPQLPKRTWQEYSKRTVVTGNEYKP